MKLSVEISKYPLDQQYLLPIKDFIDRLNQHPDIRVLTNTMSTQVFGDYDILMAVLNQEIKTSFEKFGKMIFVCKYINADLDPATPADL
ncbi:MAG: hypothetical protein ACI8WB_002738 [Phenylobacterium sp.]|jgi:uncharacterized protein YqgV (UPF0045/DUF77 family)